MLSFPSFTSRLLRVSAYSVRRYIYIYVDCVVSVLACILFHWQRFHALYIYMCNVFSRVRLYHVPFCWYRCCLRYCCCCCLLPFALNASILTVNGCVENTNGMVISLYRTPVFDCVSLCIKYLCRRYDSVSLEWSADSDGRHLRNIQISNKNTFRANEIFYVKTPSILRTRIIFCVMKVIVGYDWFVFSIFFCLSYSIHFVWIVKGKIRNWTL